MQADVAEVVGVAAGVGVVEEVAVAEGAVEMH